MKTLKDYTEITVATDEGEVLVSIAPDNITVKDGYEVRMKPDYDD